MFKNLYSNLDYVAIFPIMAMIVFMALFIGVLYYSYKMKKNTVDYFSNLPLEDDFPNQKNGDN